ncbi:hypothetical protein EAI_02615 [Harpegnathos saltator]|uniref:Uncharacterized protein n=1 Tax=Harpegnathos saltator TaxID=610380 RepID=E2BAI1_HARSA|nr:hypothetical protein EAI_02615 [Harpegnathos saltator]
MRGCRNTLIRRIGVKDDTRLRSCMAYSGRKSEPRNPKNARDRCVCERISERSSVVSEGLPFRTKRLAICHGPENRGDAREGAELLSRGRRLSRYWAISQGLADDWTESSEFSQTLQKSPRSSMDVWKES